MSLTNDQAALQARLDADKASTLAWVAEDADNRWACYATTDLAHWAEQGVTSVALYEHNRAAADHYDTYKDVNGIRCRWMDYSTMTTEQIELETAALNEQWQGEAEWEAHCDDIQNEKDQFIDRMDCDPTPSKYEAMTLRAGYEA